MWQAGLIKPALVLSVLPDQLVNVEASTQLPAYSLLSAPALLICQGIACQLC